MIIKLLKISFIIILFSACSKNSSEDYQDIPVVQEDIKSGGSATIINEGAGAYNFPPNDLTSQEISNHLVGDAAFSQPFVTFPSTQAAGLGPNFNQNSCVACHVRNGRGTIPQFDGDTNSGMLFRISMAGSGIHNDAIPVAGFGTQLQTKSIYGVTPEGKINIIYNPITETFADGYNVILQNPTYSISNTYISLPTGVLLSPRVAPPVFGLGLIDAIPTTNIELLTDENDSNGDGISGRANYVWDYETNQIRLGRFGLKASSYSLQHQTASAYHQDMGITNILFPFEHCTGQSNCISGINPNPDIDKATLDITTFYTKSLAVPARRNATNTNVLSGKLLFTTLDCAKCHVQRQQTGVSSIASLSNQIFFPYSDFLLHDMGNALSDNRTDFLATGNEWKTTPLWGIGLAKIVNTKAQFMHDGRAKTIEEAILWHGGEGQNAKNKYKQLNAQQRSDLLVYLGSL